jgi:Cellulose biosynthesis protein BcsS
VDKQRIGASFFLGGALAVAVTCGSWSPARATDLPVKAAPAPASVYTAPASVWWLGGDFKNRAATGYVGGIYALNGNLSSSGWLVRGQFTYVGSDFNSTLSSSGKVDFSLARENAAIGYQVFQGGWVFSGFVGVDNQNYHFSPSSAAPSRPKDETGAIFFGRIATASNTRYPMALEGQYSTANDDYWIRFRPGMRFNNITVGPEVVGLGNDSYDEFRVGGFLAYDFSPMMSFQVDAGYADNTHNGGAGNGGSGAYGGVTLVFLR